MEIDKSFLRMNSQQWNCSAVIYTFKIVIAKLPSKNGAINSIVCDRGWVLVQAGA